MMRLCELGLLTKRLWPREELVSAKNKLLRGRLLILVLDLLYVVLSLVFIGRVLESHSRLKRSSKNICLMEFDWGKQVVQSTFGIVKYGGVTPVNLGKSRPPP
ncbi:unnamed protein product [Prunus brigantina]